MLRLPLPRAHRQVQRIVVAILLACLPHAQSAVVEVAHPIEPLTDAMTEVLEGVGAAVIDLAVTDVYALVLADLPEGSRITVSISAVRSGAQDAEEGAAIHTVRVLTDSPTNTELEEALLVTLLETLGSNPE